jgi:hypothetical protein
LIDFLKIYIKEFVYSELKGEARSKFMDILIACIQNLNMFFNICEFSEKEIKEAEKRRMDEIRKMVETEYKEKNYGS